MRPIPKATVEEIRRALLRFYDEERRDLPWRRTRDPYRIWVSEVMLQQTRAETVVPYYERWVERFPDVAALAAAATDDVLKAWEGLGYYRRARNLQRAALIVKERHAGRVPHDPAALRALPGVGDYTAGAVASIAFGVRAPAVDGNVRRVLARLFDRARPAPAWLRATAAALVSADRAGDFNQALMELGATVCTPAAPACRSCPVAARCRARARGTVARRPAPAGRTPSPLVELATAVVLDRQRRALVVRRPERGLLAGLWSFPAAPLDGNAAGSAAAAAGAHGVAVRDPEPLGDITHIFSHRRERYHVVRFTTRGHARQHLAGPDARFVDGAALAALALPVAQRRIATLALDR